VERLRERFIRTARRTPWWGLSLLVHLIAFFILSRWKVIAPPPEEVVEAVRIVNIRPEEPAKPPLPLDVSQHVGPEPPAIEPPLPRQDLKEVVDQRAFEEALKKGEAATISVEDRSAFALRTGGGRAAAIKSGEGTEGSENAVELGLAWLARNQLPTGGWRAHTEGAAWAEPGISALATLAFLGAGYTHKRGNRYARTVERAIAYIKRHQDAKGCIALVHDGKPMGGYMYCHAMGALALAEAFGMTEDPLLREAAQRAVDFICQAQNPQIGGWRYAYRYATSDSSVSGWMIMALRSASLAGLDVPEGVLPLARKFFATVTNARAGTTAYMPGVQLGTALHAVGLLAHHYLGLPGDDPYVQRAEAVILDNPPKWVDREAGLPLPLDKAALLTATNNYYFWYYANLALHQRRSKTWDAWHPQVRDLLCRIQEREGDREGSWPPLTYGGTTGGRVYSTALAILSLEVYYRYAPMYRETVDELLAAYGDALGACNYFVRLDREKKPEAEAARKAAIEKLDRFLALSEATKEHKDPKKAAERRNQAALMLVSLYRAGLELDRAIALLKSLPDRFPGAIEPEDLVKQLADLYRALAKQLADAGEAERAAQAKATAVNLLWPIAAKSLGKNPDLELWLAAAFFEREDWQKAFDLYTARVEGVSLAKLDPKGEEGKLVLGVYDRLIKCSIALRKYKTAQWYLERVEKLIGVSLATLRQRAELCRLRKDYPAARAIYETILQPGRIPEFSKDWWETKYEQLFMAYLEGKTADVVKLIRKLQFSHPELGGDELRPRFLDLLGRAESAEPRGKGQPESPGRAPVLD